VGLHPQDSVKTIIFRAKAKFFSGRSQQPKMKKIVFIKRKNGIHSVKRDNVPEIRDFY